MSRGFGSLGSAVAVLALLAAIPAQAQSGGLFGGMFGSASKPKQTEDKNACLGAANRTLGGALFAALLPKAIACKLDRKEQKQAGEATLAATSGHDATGQLAVGSTTEWTSKTRENVKGKSTVVAQLDEPAKGMPAGSKCLTVTDVIIVNGEETTAN